MCPPEIVSEALAMNLSTTLLDFAKSGFTTEPTEPGFTTGFNIVLENLDATPGFGAWTV
jgi:hypothetical protein